MERKIDRLNEIARLANQAAAENVSRDMDDWVERMINYGVPVVHDCTDLRFHKITIDEPGIKLVVPYIVSKVFVMVELADFTFNGVSYTVRSTGRIVKVEPVSLKEEHHSALENFAAVIYKRIRDEI